jgi:hypothetical protein
MKCPTCGTENKSTNKACFRCGNVLNDSGYRPKGNVNSLWYNTADQKKVQAPPPFWADTKGKPTYEDSSDFIVLHDEQSNSNAAQDLVDSGAPIPDNKQKLEKLKGRREVHVIVPAQPKQRQQAPKTRRYKINWQRFALATVVILVLFAGATFGISALYKLAVSSFAQMFADKQGSTLTKDPRVDKILIDGETWHRITFYGKDGDMVLVTDPKRSLAIKNGKAELLLDDQAYISSDLTKDKVTVQLEATIIPQDNSQNTKITIPPYDIEVPLAPLKIVLPEESTTSTTDDSILVKVKVTPGSTHVLIGSSNVTDLVSSDGYASATVLLNPNGMNTIRIEVETPKHRKNDFDLKVERPIMEVPIQLDDKLVTSNSTSESSVLIKGSTTQGATITTNATLNGDISIKSGVFSFTAVLKRWGWNDITITAKAANGSTSSMTHRIYHKPLLADYSKKAWPLDYDTLMAASDKMIGNIYKIQGVVVKKYESDVSDYYLFNAGTLENAKQIVVEYTKEDGLKLNQYYQIFADVTGTYDNHPVLTARFVYALPMPADFATQPPTGTGSEATATPEATASAGSTN